MKRFAAFPLALAALFAVALYAVPAFAATAPATQAVQRFDLPAGEDEAKERLDTSPRHGEMIDVPAGDKQITAWIVYPERSEKAPVVLVIHEIYGLTDWIRAVADQLAAEGFIAIAPDLLTGMGPGGGGTEAFAGRDEVVKAVRGLEKERVMQMLDAVRSHAIGLPAASKNTATIGFCWGGSQSFAYAEHQPELKAAVVYYGTAPEHQDGFPKIESPVLGLYGKDDARVTSTVEATTEGMTKAGNTYEKKIFEGAGHGFLRAQSERDGANKKAAEEGWPVTLAFLRKHLEE